MARVPKSKPAPAKKKAKPSTAVEKAEPAAAAAAAAMAERAETRRRELLALKAELAEKDGGPSTDPVTRWLNATQENDVRAFVASKSKQMDQRKYQMSLVKTFLDDPSRFGLDPTDIPTSTSLQEFAERRGELEYRIGLMRSFLEILNDELKVLAQAEASARKNGSDPKN